MKLHELVTFLTDTIFRRTPDRWRNPVVRWFVRQYRLLFYTARGLREHGTLVRSAALTFYTLMSLVPILAVVFAVVKGFGYADNLTGHLHALIPQSPETIDYIVRFAENALANVRGGVMAAVALAMLFWAVVRVFGSIENAFNNIWEVKGSRNIVRQWADYITVIMIVPVLWTVATAAGGYAEEQLGLGGRGFEILSRIVSLAVIWTMFALLYVLIPNARVKYSSALTAGIVAGTIFLCFQWTYLYVQRWMTSYNAIYGSFAALPLLLIWIQTSWEIFLFGGELSFAYQNAARFAEERESLRISHDRRRKVLVAAMVAVVRRFRGAGGTISAEEIRSELELPTRIVNDILYQLVQARLLIAVPGEQDDRLTGYVPGRDLSQTTLCDVVDAVEGIGEVTFDLDTRPEQQQIDRAVDRLKCAARESEDNIRLTDLI